MALTRKMLAAMEISAEKIDEIINAHIESINTLKEENEKLQRDLDALKGKSADIETLKSDLEAANTKLKEFEANDWESKYNDLEKEYNQFKTDTEAKSTKATKESAYKQLLVDAGIPSKRIDSIIKVSESNINSIEFDEDGNVVDADKITESVKTEWADFIPVKREKGADVANPPLNDGETDIKKPSRASELVAQYRKEHYGNPAKED